MSEFDVAPDTKPTITIPNVVFAVEVAPLPDAPDFAEQKTVELELCWKCGPRFIEVDGVRIREPRLAIFCECPMEETTVEVRK